MENNIVLQVGMKILLQNDEGKYLLIHRSLDKYSDVKGRWDIVGGRINLGTSLVENLRREIKEETNLELAGGPTLIGAQDILKNDKHIVRLTYIGKSSGEVKLDLEENDKYQWCAFEELKKTEDLDIYFKELLNNKPPWNMMSKN